MVGRTVATMPDGITHHPSVKAPPIPNGHTRVCWAAAWGAATRVVIAEWNPQGRYYGPGGATPEADAEIGRRAWDLMVDGTHCLCSKKVRRR